MHFSVSKKELSEKISKILNVSSSKMDVLNNFILSVSNDKSFVYATDLETAVRLNFNCNVMNEGVVCINTKKFYEIIKELPEEIYVEAKGNWVHITSGKTHIKISTFPVGEYPVWQEDDFIVNFEIPCSELNELIEKTIFASGDNDTRYVLNSLLFHMKDNIIRVVGTDGHRLSIATDIMDNFNFPEEMKWVVPKKSAYLVQKLIGQCETVKIHLSNKYMKFQTDNFDFSVRLYDGEYPNYMGVIPKENDKIAIIDKNSFISAVKRVSSVSNSIGNTTTPVVLQFNKDIITVECKETDIGEAKEDISVEYNGDSFIIGFNSKYLVDAVSHAETEKVVLSMLNQKSSVYLKEFESTNKIIYEHVLMPVVL